MSNTMKCKLCRNNENTFSGLCHVCAISEINRLRYALKQIVEFNVPEPAYGAEFELQEIAKKALNRWPEDV